MGKPVLLADIAKAAQTSVVTVGKVLNGGGATVRVGAKTRERILAMAAELGYRPNMAASILAGGSSKLVGIIIDTMTSFRGRELVTGIERQCAKRGWRLIVCSAHDNAVNIRQNYSMLLGYGVTGVLCLGHDYPELATELSDVFANADREPVVFFERPLFPAARVVESCRRRALTGLVGDALKRGYRRIGVMHGDRRAHSERALRREFEAALQANGCEINPDMELEYRSAHLEPGEVAELAVEQLLRPHRPDLLFVDDAETATALQMRINYHRFDTVLYGGNANPLFRQLLPAVGSFDPGYDRIARALVEVAAGDESLCGTVVESTYKHDLTEKK